MNRTRDPWAKRLLLRERAGAFTQALDRFSEQSDVPLLGRKYAEHLLDMAASFSGRRVAPHMLATCWTLCNTLKWHAAFSARVYQGALDFLGAKEGMVSITAQDDECQRRFLDLDRALVNVVMESRMLEVKRRRERRAEHPAAATDPKLH